MRYDTLKANLSFCFLFDFLWLEEIASNGLDHGFGRFWGEMRSNQMCIVNQHVMRGVLGKNPSDCKSRMAKRGQKRRFSAFFGVDFVQTWRGEISNEACLIGQKGVPLFPTPHAAMASSTLSAIFFALSENNRKTGNVQNERHFATTKWV